MTADEISKKIETLFDVKLTFLDDGKVRARGRDEGAITTICTLGENGLLADPDETYVVSVPGRSPFAHTGPPDTIPGVAPGDKVVLHVGGMMQVLIDGQDRLIPALALGDYERFAAACAEATDALPGQGLRVTYTDPSGGAVRVVYVVAPGQQVTVTYQDVLVTVLRGPGEEITTFLPRAVAAVYASGRLGVGQIVDKVTVDGTTHDTRALVGSYCVNGTWLFTAPKHNTVAALDRAEAIYGVRTGVTLWTGGA